MPGPGPLSQAQRPSARVACDRRCRWVIRGGPLFQLPCRGAGVLEKVSAGRGSPQPTSVQAERRREMSYETLLYTTGDAIATITLNRPDRLNTIVPPMPDELEAAVNEAVADDAVKVIVLRGAGRSFCAGFDLGGGFHHWDERLTTDGKWDPGKDFVMATSPTFGPVPKFMSIWRSPKPVIAQVHGWCVGGGSDMALCADLVIASEDARIGTPYSRMWGCYLTGMWIYRLGLTRAKEYALTGKPFSGSEAAEIALINRAVPFAELEAEVRATAERLAS